LYKTFLYIFLVVTNVVTSFYVGVWIYLIIFLYINCIFLSLISTNKRRSQYNGLRTDRRSTLRNAAIVRMMGPPNKKYQRTGPIVECGRQVNERTGMGMIVSNELSNVTAAAAAAATGC